MSKKKTGNFVFFFTTPNSGRVSKEVSCGSRATTAKKCTKKRDARAKLLFCCYKPIAFFPFLGSSNNC